MTQTYSQIQKKIETLQRQADKLRDQEIHGVIDRIKTAIAHYGLTAAQLGFGGGALSGRKTTSGSNRDAKFGDGQGNWWSGRGPRPHWLRDALNAGRLLEEFALAPDQTTGPAKKKKLSSRRPSSVLYRDGAGNSWTGRGPRPRWLKEALEGGKTLEELAR